MLSKIIPPVGKSGPFTICIISSILTWVFSMISFPSWSNQIVCGFPSLWRRRSEASKISVKLWGAIFVAIPTAIPIVPLQRWFGNFVGSITGSFKEPSKLSLQSTVSWSISSSISSAILVNLASVYLIAAAPSPSIDPKFPCPSTSGYLSDQGWASLTIAS